MAVIFLVALSVRLFHLWQVSHAPFFSILIGDARAYDAWAQQIAAGDWVGRDVFYQAPLYPYLLGTFYSLFGRNLLLVRVAQAVGGALACVCLAGAGARLFSKRAGTIAGLMLAVYPPAVFFDGLLQKTTLDALLICVVLWLVARLVAGSERVWLWTALGASVGALCLTRENALVFVPVILAWILAGRARAQTAPWRAAALFIAGAAALLFPAAARNYAVSGGLYVTTSQLGPNLYIGNNAGADGTYRALRPGRGTAEFERIDAIALAEAAAGHQLTPGQVSAFWTGRVLDFVAAEPIAWSRLMVRKARLLANRVEVIDSESQDSWAEWSLILRAGATVGHFGVLLPLAVIGLWLTGERLRTVWIVPALATAYAASVVTFYVFARYRLPLVPFVVLWAAAGVAMLPNWIRAHRGARDRLVLLGAVAATAALANWPIVSAASMQAVGENNLGVALQAEGRGVEALDHFRRATGLDPSEASAYVNMGIALQAAGRREDAIAAFVTAARLRPALGEAHYFLGKTLVEEGRTPEAVSELRLAVPLMPGAMEVRTTLGIALASQQHVDEAIAEFREVVRVQPGFANAAWNLGSALAAAGNLREAIPYLEEAVRRDPSNSSARRDLADAHNQRGFELATAGALAEAKRAFEEALRLDPSFTEAQRNLATATALAAPISQAGGKR